MKKDNPPPGYNLLQSFIRTYKQVKDPIGSMEESMERFKGTYTVNLGRKRLLATQDPGLIEYVLKGNHKNYHKSAILTEQLGRFIGNGLLTSNGEYWLKQRRLIQPGFHIDKVHALYGIIKKTVDDFLTTMPTGENVNVYPYMNKLAFEIVINSLFNIKVPLEDRNQLSNFISETQDFVIKDIRQPYKSWWFKISGEVKNNLKKAAITRKIIRDIIRERKKSENKFNDLLDMLLDARYEDNGEPMHEEQVIDEILILIIAGHETTANALSWTLYLLANNPEELRKVKQSTHDISVNDTVANEQLNAVIKESMRLYPPAWISDRVALEDDTYNGYTFSKNTILILFYYGVHRDSKYWENPTAFIPERFLNNHKPKAYYPFGGGPRLCIGSNFAMAEMVIFLQAAIQNFEFTPTGVEPLLHPLVTLRPDKVILGVRKIIK
ncbi:MAG TPA: cytochrome P450 [Cyclobacteriaceae bacterium]|nr:cytochrome P450 [Cyclobacteriaceae bacterium]